MPRRYYSSIAVRTTLSSAINSSTTSITVAAVTGFPTSYPYTLVIDEGISTQEIVTVTAGSGTTLTVTRGSDGSTAVAHSSGATVNHGVSARDYDEPNDFIQSASVDLTEARQFGAAGSVLDNVPMRVHPAEQLLKYSVLWLDAAHSSASNQTIQNLGWGGSALNAQTGSTGSADSNDPLFLDWTGQNYVYLPGVAGNFLSVPDEAALDITGDIDIRVQVALDDWTPAAVNYFAAKMAGGDPQRSWRFGVNTTGTLSLEWYPLGTNASVIAKFSTVVTNITDGATKWVRVTLDVDNGAAGNDVKFFLSDDGVTWTQLGLTVTTAGTTSIAATSSIVGVGKFGSPDPSTSGSIYRAQIFNGIDGTPVLDVDCTQIVSGSDTEFTALTGQTVTINRSTAGRKSVAVVNPCWLFGTDDYMEVADNDLIDFGAADSFTVLWVGRIWATPGNTARALQKGPGPSYSLRNSGTTNAMAAHISDGTNAQSATSSYVFGNVSVIAGVVDRSAQTIVANVNGVASASASTTSVGSLVSASPLRINTVPAAYLDSELLAVAVFRRALTPTEITTISNYYTGRIG